MSIRKTSGRIVGAVILVSAVTAVIYFRPKKEVEPADNTVRPIKSVVIGETFKDPDLYFPGLVDADRKVELSFNVSGQLAKFDVVEGQEMKKGDLIAQLDDTSFQNEVKDAQAELTRSEATYKRMEKALKSNAISKEEFSKAEADFNKARARLEISKKNLKDTKILARFDGVIAESHVANFDTVSVGQKIVDLQNNEFVDIVVSIPEQYLIHKQYKNKTGKVLKFHAVFDALPDEKFDLVVKEYSTQADFKTQTYTVSFQMKTPEKFNILPGMSATVVVENFFTDDKSKAADLIVESDHVGINSSGEHFVWVLEATDKEGVYKAVQRSIKVGRRSGTTLQVLEGLKKGERIAAAGITILVEGRKVSLLAAKPADKEG